MTITRDNEKKVTSYLLREIGRFPNEVQREAQNY